MVGKNQGKIKDEKREEEKDKDSDEYNEFDEPNETFYTENEEIQKKLKNGEIDIEDLALSDLLASKRTELANTRNIYALKRTSQASERTYVAWVRTGFSVASAGVAIAGLLTNTDYASISTPIGLILILVGLFCFVYAWGGYVRTYKFLGELLEEDQEKGMPQRVNLILIHIVSFILIAIYIFAFILIIRSGYL